MDAWHIWVVVGLLLALAELLGLGFFALALGLACLAGALSAALAAPFSVQLLATGITGAVLAPLLSRSLRHASRSNRFASLAGEGRPQKGSVVVGRDGDVRVRVEGDMFPVRSLSGRVLEQGATVIIHRFDGITALVD